MIGHEGMWHLDTRELLHWIGSIAAKLLVLLFVAPFVVMGTAAAFAIVAAQYGTIPGAIAAGAVVIAIALGLNHWLWIVGRETT
jgi:hypothetical protein